MDFHSTAFSVTFIMQSLKSHSSFYLEEKSFSKIKDEKQKKKEELRAFIR